MRLYRLKATVLLLALSLNSAAHPPQPRPASGRAGLSLPLDQQKRIAVEDAPRPSFSDLVNVFAELSAGQRRDLGPLTRAERRLLLTQEPGRTLRERIGVIRRVRPPIRLTNLTDAHMRVRQSATRAGGRADSLPDGRLVWTTGISSPGATGIRVEFTKATLPPGAKVFVTDGRENRTVTPTRTIHLQ